MVTVLTMGSSCSSGRNLSTNNVIKNSVWVNTIPTELGNEKGTIVNSLYFMDNNQVVMKSGVCQGTKIIGTPILTGYGTYDYSGSLKKGIKFKIDTKTVTVGKKVDYTGLITPEGMMLIEPDSTAYIYYKVETSK